MPKKKTYKTKKKKQNELSEPLEAYDNHRLRIFNSFEDQEVYELKQMAQLTGKEILQQLRKFINIAFGMHGYDPENLPENHDIKIIKSSDEHI